MKRKFFALFALILIPAFAFLGCGATKTFKIETNVSNPYLGTSSGGSVSPFEQNKKLTLKANEFYETNPFVCWIKNYSAIVSTQKEFDLTVTQSTEGTYTAVFDDDVGEMQFASLYQMEYIGTENYTNFTYSVEYASNESATNLITLCEGEQTQKNMNVFNGNVFYLHGVPARTFQFTIKITATTSDGNISFTFPPIENILVSNQSFENEIYYAVNTTDNNFKLTFAKINTDFLSQTSFVK